MGKDIISLIRYLRIDTISNNILSNLEDFIYASSKIANRLNTIYEKHNPNKPLALPVICPGDSPTKFVRYLKKSGLIVPDHFHFIEFSLSNMADYYTYFSILDDTGL